jgi:hypothetical protein
MNDGQREDGMRTRGEERRKKANITRNIRAIISRQSGTQKQNQKERLS